jgi:hypothetical protein
MALKGFPLRFVKGVKSGKIGPEFTPVLTLDRPQVVMSWTLIAIAPCETV